MRLRISKPLLFTKHEWIDSPRSPTSARCLSASSIGPFSEDPLPVSNRATYEGMGEYHQLGQRAREKLADREFFLSLLSCASTKREAKSYLSRFQSSPTSAQRRQTPEEITVSQTATKKPEINPSNPFTGASRAVSHNPVFRQHPVLTRLTEEKRDQRLHLALVKITSPQSLDDHTIQGVALTLSQLTRLGMASCVVIDPGLVEDASAWRRTAVEQADRLSAAIDSCNGPEVRCLDPAITVDESAHAFPTSVSRGYVLKPLQYNHTVVVIPVGCTRDTSRVVPLPANDVVLALTREFAGLGTTPDPDDDPKETAKRVKALQKEVSLDRLILLDPLGGIPAFSGPHRSHVFINMEQEFGDIENELLQQIASCTVAKGLSSPLVEQRTGSILYGNQVLQRDGPEAIGTISVPHTQERHWHIQGVRASLQGHLENLRLLQQTLAILPPSSSGIVTTPSDVADSANHIEDTAPVSAVGTRRQKNPLIHNLLTDKPYHSSSLPSSRLAVKNSPLGRITPTMIHSTFFKRGMPLTILPDPRVTPWTPKITGEPRLTVDNPQIDLPRLVHLIEDSFNRKLNVQHYLDRINHRIAGLVIAGEYEGGAILTWEVPPGVVDDGSEASMARMVPYLDKFAVLKQSQGAGGVADIVFNAMVRSCFPQGVCWRSRRDNPVNKWYFERAGGSWKLPGSNWTMFWTTPCVPENGQKFKDYEAVCSSIQPSWADNRDVVD